MDGESEFAAVLDMLDDLVPTIGTKRVDEPPSERGKAKAVIRRALLLADKVKRDPSAMMLEAGVDDGQNWGFDISALNMRGFLKAMVKQAEKELANAD